jgi:hypothetical protein
MQGINNMVKLPSTNVTVSARKINRVGLRRYVVEFTVTPDDGKPIDMFYLSVRLPRGATVSRDDVKLDTCFPGKGSK